MDGRENASPPEVVSSEENYLYLKTRERFFDATCGAVVSCLGHGNDEVIKAVTDQLLLNAYSSSMVFTTGVATELADEVIWCQGSTSAAPVRRLLRFRATG